MKKYFDNKKKEFTEAQMVAFALDYFERFCEVYAQKDEVDMKAADKFFDKRVALYRKVGIPNDQVLLMAAGATEAYQ